MVNNAALAKKLDAITANTTPKADAPAVGTQVWSMIKIGAGAPTSFSLGPTGDSKYHLIGGNLFINNAGSAGASTTDVLIADRMAYHPGQMDSSWLWYYRAPTVLAGDYHQTSFVRGALGTPGGSAAGVFTIEYAPLPDIVLEAGRALFIETGLSAMGVVNINLLYEVVT